MVRLTGAGDGQFEAPTGLAVDSAGNSYVLDVTSTTIGGGKLAPVLSRIQKFDATGTSKYTNRRRWSRFRGLGQRYWLNPRAPDSLRHSRHRRWN